jgi:hypothetical protein
MSALVGGIVIVAVAVVQGFAPAGWAGADDDQRELGRRSPGMYRPRSGEFDVQVLIGGRPLRQENWGGVRRVEAVRGAEYELRLVNPLPDRVAVSVSVDGLNIVDARHTNSWDASKWVIHAHGTLTITGWQVGSERARRLYFTTERDAYATRIGRPGDFGVISAVFYRERRKIPEITRHRSSMPEQRQSLGQTAEAETGPAVRLRSAPGGEDSSRRRLPPYWHHEGRAATGIGRSVPSEVREVQMELEREPVAVVTLRYAFHHSYTRPKPAPGFAPEPGESGTRPDDGRFAPEP